MSTEPSQAGIPGRPRAISVPQRPRRAQGFLLVSLGAPLWLCGCHEVGRVVDPLNVLGLAKPPIRAGVTTLDLAPPLMLPKWELFRLALTHHFQEPVQFELMTPRQIRVHLGTGRLKFALLSPSDYAQIAPAQTCEILGVPINQNNQTSRQGLIIVGAKSPVQSLSETKSQRFHFMPIGDLLNDAAAGALLEAGIDRKHIDQGILGLGLDTHHISSLEVAKSVVLEDKVAGVIDEADYNKWPKAGGSFVLLLPSQDQVRVIGKTVRIPEGPFVISAKADTGLKEKARDFLFNTVPKKHALALAAMNYKGFAQPVDPKEYEPFGEIYVKLHPPEAKRPAEQKPPETRSATTP